MVDKAMETITTRIVFTTLGVQRAERSAYEIMLIRSRKRWLACLLVSSTLGLLAGVFGLGCSAIYALGFLDASGHVGGEITLLLVTSFPLLFLAAHSLDRIREIEKKIKVDHYKRHGYRDLTSTENQNEK